MIDLFHLADNGVSIQRFLTGNNDGTVYGFYTWQKPKGIEYVYILAISPGAGGGGGASAASGTQKGGGGGGGSGGVVRLSILASLLPDILYISVGLLGSGGYGTFLQSAVADLGVDITMLESLVSLETVSHVIIATPNDTHFALARAALQAGKPVLCEKPLALHQEEIAHLQSLAQAKGLFLGVGFVLHHHPFYQTIKNLQKEYGPIQAMRVYNHATEGLLEPEWYWDNQRSGGWFMVAEIHWYHLFAWLTDSREFAIDKAKEDRVNGRTVATRSKITSAAGQSLTVDHRLDCSYDTCWTKVEIEFADFTCVIDDWVPQKLTISPPLTLPLPHFIQGIGQSYIEMRDRDAIYAALIRMNIEQLLDSQSPIDPSILPAHVTALAAQTLANSST